MRTYELRLVTLGTKEASISTRGRSIRVTEKVFRCSGGEAHGMSTDGDVAPRLLVLVSYAEGDIAEVGRQYLQSAELAEDVSGYDVGNIKNVALTMLLPAKNSPLG